MNSYPAEFLTHPQPLMFVAGLTSSHVSSSRRSSGGTSGTGTRSRSTSIAGFTSPLQDEKSLPISSGPMEHDETSPPGRPSPSASVSESTILPPVPTVINDRDREFEKLESDLRGALAGSGHRPKVWVAPADRRRFRIVLVDKNVRLPIRKQSPTDATDALSTVPRSPLSPLTPTSTQYPDGLIAPVWVRKHTDLVPAVFVLFLRLFECAPRPPRAESVGPLVPNDDAELDAADRAKEKEMDDGLIKEITQRSSKLNERKIKLTVVLMASASTLDSPHLDGRLSYLRRHSALSTKASLFVLTPVPAAELPEFVLSLQDALYDAAIEYYTNHGKRVRKKRARVPVNASSLPQSAAVNASSSSSGTNVRALGPQGWAVRYDWKSAWFAEMRGELEQARRHYEDCWNELAKMFASTTTMPPRTKRWAEAKVLADCVAMRICKLLLYDNGGSRVLGPFYVHLKRFGDLSRGWGIGEETYEFWSWIARQYRIFAELVDLATRAGFVIPPIPDVVLPAPPLPGSLILPSLEELNTPTSVSNPLHVLHRPGFYFYSAAICTVERKSRFEDALEAEREGGAKFLATAPGFVNEKAVDHAALIIELLTRAYDLFNVNGKEQSRLSLFIAFRIAETHCQARQFDQAMQFLDVISDNLETEKWSPIAQQIRAIWYECAQSTGSVEIAARLLLEMMAPGSGVDEDERAALQDDILTLFKTTAPSSVEPIIVDGGEDGLFDARVGFREADAFIGSKVLFQLSLATPSDVDLSGLEFSKLRLSFSDSRPDLVIVQGGLSRIVDAGVIGNDKSSETVSASLKWKPDTTLIVTGQVVGDVPSEIEVSEITLTLSQGSWTIDIRLTPRALLEWTSPKGATFVPIGGLFNCVRFTSQDHSLAVRLSHPPVAFIGELMPISVIIDKTDHRAIEMRISILLQPGSAGSESDGSMVVFENEQSAMTIKDVPIGTFCAGSERIERKVMFKAPRAGTKLLEISVSSEVHGTPSQSPKVQTVTAVIPVISAFACSPTVRHLSVTSAVISAIIRSPGPRAVRIDDISVIATSESVQLVSTSLNVATFPQTWDFSTTFALYAQFTILASDQSRSDPPPTPSSSVRITWRPVDAGDESQALITLVPLPHLAKALQDSFVTASLSSPAVVQSHEPFTMELRVANTHPSEEASFAIHADTADGFVWSGMRSAKIGPVPAGGERRVRVDALAVGAAGWQSLPTMTVWQSDGAERREVRVSASANRPDGNSVVLVRP